MSDERLRPAELPYSAGLRADVTDPLVRVSNLSKVYRSGRGRKQPEIPAAADVSFDIVRGETLGLVGESGSGKSTVARCFLRIVEPTSGSIFFDGADITALAPRELRALRSRMQVVFQDPYSSLDPRMSVWSIVDEPLRLHGYGRRDSAARRERIAETLSLVGLSAAEADRRPHAFSGGQRQRIALARALALRPEMLVLDEPVTALDVSVQAQVLNVLMDLREQLGLTYLFIVHDLTVAEIFCHRVAVMYLGRVVELGPSREVFRRPLHPYSVSLIESSPLTDPTAARARSRPQVTGDTSSRPAGGCPFQPRCPLGKGREVCRTTVPPLAEHEPGRWAACHFPGELQRRVD